MWSRNAKFGWVAVGAIGLAAWTMDSSPASAGDPPLTVKPPVYQTNGASPAAQVQLAHYHHGGGHHYGYGGWGHHRGYGYGGYGGYYRPYYGPAFAVTVAPNYGYGAGYGNYGYPAYGYRGGYGRCW